MTTILLFSRYKGEGQLTVTKLSTGGASVNHASSVNTNDKHFTFAPGVTPLFVGGLPTGYMVSNAIS